MSAVKSKLSDSESLREMLRPLFWDCDFDELDLNQHRDFVIRRILESGTWDAVCWLRQDQGDETLRKWIAQHEGRSLSPQQLRYWELVLELPAESVDRWLQSPERRVWEGRIRK
jgi:hypothetical protein